ncbi:MAG: bifunctional phosphopantothenoylcysteine decarboxylase/phosphopantothenate--cysteine ligase CoaBC, partial [Fibrobacter sp.]|nr:bifunctional phosphopantothenoylcysteine decarboxylase/phosphopantothenate--cysteine ligase CoaBC [Fibrobacter sp.]
MLRNYRILVGITGGIAAYKIPHLVRLFKKQNAEVKVVLTPEARGLVGEGALLTVSGNPVYRDDASFYDMDHIRLSEWADLFLICPATANSIAKIAHGIGDNLLTTLALSIPESKIMIAPAMNTVMWENKATQENIATVKSHGIMVLPVGSGELACGTSGAGRMIEPEEIVQTANSFLRASGILQGKHVLIASGPTEEAIDPVRVITNRSTGKMGAALAKEALLMGATVTVVSGPASEPLPSGAEVIPVKSAQQMHDALHGKFTEADICIMAAAVSDYRPATVSETKIQRNEAGKLVLELVPNPDISASLGKIKGKRLLVGFSLESGDSENRALEKMKKKGCDLIIFNRA